MKKTRKERLSGCFQGAWKKCQKSSKKGQMMTKMQKWQEKRRKHFLVFSRKKLNNVGKGGGGK
jgi:hypothetical protein